MITINLDDIAQQLPKDYDRTFSHRVRLRSHLSQKKKIINSDEEDEPLQKLKKIKQQANNAKKQLNQALKKYQQLKKQVGRNEKEAHIAKVNCLKLFEVKKHKIINKTLLEQSKQRIQQQNEKKLDNAKKLKLEQEYFGELIKNQELYKRFRMREEFSKYKLSVRQALNYKNKLFEEEVKEKYIAIKASENRHYERKKIFESMINERCKENYVAKLQKEIKKIQAYNDLMVKLQQQQKVAIEGFVASRNFQNKAHEDINSVLKSDQKKQSFFITERRQIKTAYQRRSFRKN